MMWLVPAANVTQELHSVYVLSRSGRNMPHFLQQVSGAHLFSVLSLLQQSSSSAVYIRIKIFQEPHVDVRLFIDQLRALSKPANSTVQGPNELILLLDLPRTHGLELENRQLF